MSLRIGSLFSGIGGLDLGLERAGVGRVVWQVERDPFCRVVLRRHWPDAVVYSDVTEVKGGEVEPVEVLCGGFPCTDVSASATARNRGRTGLDGAASGLWREYARLVEEIRPAFVVVENVNSGQADWLPDVRRDLWRGGYTSLPFRVRAADVGAPHLRSRIFVVAYPERAGREGDLLPQVARAIEAAVDTARRGGHPAWRRSGRDVVPDAALRRGGDGFRGGLDRRRTRALGNAVVPQVAEVVGRVVVALRAVLEPVATSTPPGYTSEPGADDE